MTAASLQRCQSSTGLMSVFTPALHTKDNCCLALPAFCQKTGRLWYWFPQQRWLCGTKEIKATSPWSKLKLQRQKIMEESCLLLMTDLFRKHRDTVELISIQSGEQTFKGSKATRQTHRKKIKPHCYWTQKHCLWLRWSLHHRLLEPGEICGKDLYSCTSFFLFFRGIQY